MKTRLLPLAVFALAAAACGSMTNPADDTVAPEKSSAEIIGGVDDTTGHPAVVLIQNNAGFLCTGTVIGPSVVLTAGHCSVLDDTCTPGNCVTRAPNGYTVSAGFDPSVSTDWFFGSGAGSVGSIVAVHTDPAYNGNAGANFIDHDVAVLILGNIAPVTPMPWNASNAAVYTSGQSITWSGYGLAHHPISDPTPAGNVGSGRKRTVTMTMTAVGTDRFDYGNATTNTCSGDSGGPAIANILGIDTVVGTVSFGDQDCSMTGTDMRTDFYAPFITQYANISNTPTPTPSHTPVPTPTPGADHSKRGPLGLNCAVAGTGDAGAGIALGGLAFLVLAIRSRRRN